MSYVSYFQRFSQAENHATNNTLLILRYFYQSSPLKLQNVLTSLTDTELAIGVTFDQQIKGIASVPDALISQEPLNIYIETKVGENLDIDQIKRHLISISEALPRAAMPILIGLTKEAISPEQRAECIKSADEKKIGFASVTFTEVVEALRTQCEPYEAVLTNIIDDYENFLASENLLETRNTKMAVFPCGTSFEDNKQYGLYYEPISRRRRLKASKILGIYRNKKVELVGTIQAVANCTYVDGDVRVDSEETSGNLTHEQRRRVKEVIENTGYYDLKAEHRFYLVDSFTETNLRKTSPGGLMGLRYLDIGEIIGTDFDAHRNYTTSEIAALLSGKTFA